MGYNIMVTILMFQIMWRAADHAVNPRCECLLYSRTFGKDFGTFNSPDYPKPYPTMVDCLLYTFLANTNEVIEITFKDFNIYKSNTRCVDGDYVKVYGHIEDGKINEYTSSDNTLCGRYSEVPHVLYSSVPAFVLEFHSSDKNTNSTGFIGTFRFVDNKIFQTDGIKIAGTKCDMQFDSENSSQTGKFFSPRYPASYPRPSKCSYHFRAKSDERIKIVFEEVFFQKGDDSCLNRQDTIKVYDGWSSSSNNILFLCNEVTAVEVYSTGRRMFVEFDAKDRLSGQGFKATYYFQNLNELLDFKEIQQAEFRKTINGGGFLYNNMLQRMGPTSNKLMYARVPQHPSTKSSCEVFFRSVDRPNGTFSSPLYPRPYPSSSRCLFVFQGRGRDRVQIVFNDFNLYHVNKEPKICTGADSVTIAIKIEGRIEKLITFCGSENPPPVMSSGPIMAVEFIGYYSSTNIRGFTASYHFVQNYGIENGYQISLLPCAFQYNNTHEEKSQLITSPNFPGYYPRNMECHYFFQADNKQKIQLTFVYFDVEGISPCDENSESDYVEFSNYMAHDNRFSRYCGNLSAFTVTSNSNTFRVTFKSNGVLDGSGFKATYKFIDDIEETTTEKRLVFDTSNNTPAIAIRLEIMNTKDGLVLCSMILLHAVLSLDISFH